MQHAAQPDPAADGLPIPGECLHPHPVTDGGHWRRRHAIVSSVERLSEERWLRGGVEEAGADARRLQRAHLAAIVPANDRLLNTGHSREGVRPGVAEAEVVRPGLEEDDRSTA